MKTETKYNCLIGELKLLVNQLYKEDNTEDYKTVDRLLWSLIPDSGQDVNPDDIEERLNDFLFDLNTGCENIVFSSVRIELLEIINNYNKD